MQAELSEAPFNKLPIKKFISPTLATILVLLDFVLQRHLLSLLHHRHGITDIGYTSLSSVKDSVADSRW